MKKTFRFFGMMLCIMLTAVCFTACGDDDGDDDSSIVGTWQLVEEEGYETLTTFKANGTVISTEKDLDDGDEYTDTGRYTFDGEILTIWWDDEPEDDPDIYRVTIKGDRLTTYDEDGYQAIFYRR